MVSIRAILFDVGGILIQKQKQKVQDLFVIQRMVDLLGIQKQPEALIAQINQGETEYKAYRMQTLTTLPNAEKWSRFLLPHFPGNIIGEQAKTLQQLWKESFGERHLAPGVHATLKVLASRGYILATVSHTDPNLIESAEIQQLFTASICASDFGIRKPHPSIFIAAAQACGVSLQACAYVGDRPSRDIIGSRVAGIGKVIMVENEYSTHESEPCPMQPDETINEISELLGLFPGKFLDTPIEMPQQHLYDCALSSVHRNSSRESLNQFFENGRKQGFSRFELNYGVSPDDFATMDLNRFYFSTLHNPCPAIWNMKELERQDCLLSSLDRKSQMVAIDVLKNTIDTAYHLGARSIVIHPGLIKCDHSLDDELRKLYQSGMQNSRQFQTIKQKLILDRKQKSAPHLDALTNALAEIVQFAAGSNLMLGIENLLAYYEMPSFDELQHLLNEFQEPWFGWQLDLGHIVIQENLGLESTANWLQTFGKRMIGIHLHDVIGLIDHMAPGTGDVDFVTIAPFIPSYAQCTVEVRPDIAEDDVLNCLPFLETQGCINKLF